MKPVTLKPLTDRTAKPISIGSIIDGIVVIHCVVVVVVGDSIPSQNFTIPTIPSISHSFIPHSIYVVDVVVDHLLKKWPLLKPTVLVSLIIGIIVNQYYYCYWNYWYYCVLLLMTVLLLLLFIHSVSWLMLMLTLSVFDHLLTLLFDHSFIHLSMLLIHLSIEMTGVTIGGSPFQWQSWLIFDCWWLIDIVIIVIDISIVVIDVIQYWLVLCYYWAFKAIVDIR